MEKKQAKIERRNYSVTEIAAVFAIVIVIALLFDSTGLKVWAGRLDVGPSRTFFVSATDPLNSVMSNLKLDTPRRGLRDGFFTVMGKKREAGFMLANSGDEIPESYDLSTGESGDEIGSWMNSPHVGWNSDDDIPQTPSEIPTTGNFSPGNPLNVLMIGDSMMGDGFGTEMQRALEADESMTSRRYPRHSSGLSRPDYYNWPAQVMEIFAGGEYDAVVVLLGTNDAQNFVVDGTVRNRFDEYWSREYHERLMQFLRLLSSRTQRTYWVGMPPMRESGYNERMQKLNSFFEEGCELSSEAEYISAVELLGDESGGFTSYLDIDGTQVHVRHTDGIHLTRAGGNLIVDRIMELIRTDFNFGLENESDLPPVF